MAKFIPRLLTFLLLAKLTVQQKLEPIVCDCGFTDENNNYWSNVWHSDFTTYQESIHLDSNYVVSTFTIPAKRENTLDRVFSKDNADILNGHLRLAVTNDNGDVKCGSISTSSESFLYGSFRANMKITAVPGTVSAFYLYKNDTSEIDMETLSVIQDPWQVYLSVKPQIYNANGSAAYETLRRYSESMNPTDDFHEYRFDWFPSAINYYLDGQLVETITTNVPSAPGRVSFNHWTDGNINYSKGPPTESAFLEISNVTVFYNSSSESSMGCSKMSAGCNVSDIVQRRILPATSLNSNYTSLYTSSSSKLQATTVSIAACILILILVQ
ncbi:concanavalin A-like lectin/glucanase domain-containing protein [Umbelopsis sp. AD052]|nr:concanavalin A-like lectin/glucanase domain-containing protein [Umbelopsis sp. AD052]